MALKFPLVAGLLLVAAVFLVAPAAAELAPELKYANILASTFKNLTSTLFGQSNTAGSTAGAQFAGSLQLAGYGPSNGGRRLLKKHKSQWESSTDYSRLDFDFRVAATVIQDILPGGTFATRRQASIGGFLSGDVVFPTSAVQEIEDGINSLNPDEFLDGLVNFIQDGAWAGGIAALPYTVDKKDVSFTTSDNSGSPLKLTSYSVAEFDRSLLSIGAVASIGGPVTGSKSIKNTAVTFPANGDDIFGFDSDRCFVAYVQASNGVVDTFVSEFFFAIGQGASLDQAFGFASSQVGITLNCIAFYEGQLTYTGKNGSPGFKNYFTATEAINTGNLGEFAGKKSTLKCSNLQLGGVLGSCLSVPALPKAGKNKGKLL